MGMFDNYQNESYTAYNLTPRKESHLIERYFHSPIIGYDKYNNIKCFIWDPEDKFTLNLNLGIKVKVFSNSIIYQGANLAPGNQTEGFLGQKAYNLVDGKSWTCKGKVEDNLKDGDWIPLENVSSETLPEWIPIIPEEEKAKFMFNATTKEITNSMGYIWEEDPIFTLTDNGDKEVIVMPKLTNANLIVTIMNFRHEVIYNYKFENQNNCSIKISKEDTPLLVEGQFFINTYIESENTKYEQSQYNVTIIENPNKYIQSKLNATYSFGYTIQPEGDDYYKWEPLGDATMGGDYDYVWIPISKEVPETIYEAYWDPVVKQYRKRTK